MELKDALDNLEKVCSMFRGTLQEHSSLQLSLQTVKSALKMEEEEHVSKEKKE